MGQSQAMPLPEEKLDVVCDIFSQGLLYSTQKVKAYLGFRDPEQKLRVSTSTLDEIFLAHFISFCQEKGVGDRIVTCKMSRCQQLLLGVDWIWTISGSDRSVRLQIAVQTVQMNESFTVTEMDEDPYQRILEKSLSDLEMKSGSRFDKLIDFSSSIGWNCIGLCIVYGLPGKPKEMKGVLSDSVSSGLATESPLAQRHCRGFYKQPITSSLQRKCLKTTCTRETSQTKHKRLL